MVILKIAFIAVAAMVALTSAWSTQFPQIFRTFPPALPALPQFRPFFQDTEMLQPRFYVHHRPQFRHPLQLLYQPPPLPQPQAARSPAPVPIDLSPPPTASDAAGVHHHHHHHHVFHYYYSPTATDGTAATGSNDFGRNVQRQPCDPVFAGAPSPPSHLPPQPPTQQPGYLPPPSPSPPTPTTGAPPAAAQPPCDHDDDAVVVDNVDYFPFGRSPIVVATSSATSVADRGRTGGEPRQDGRSRQNFAATGRQQNRSNFILANYLLPPDK